jgi:ABC-type multidrug transport system permease subunit
MPYDVPLILSLVMLFFAVLGTMSSLMEKQSPIRHVFTFAAAAGLFGYAWYVSNGEMGLYSVPGAFLRIVSKFS